MASIRLAHLSELLEDAHVMAIEHALAEDGTGPLDEDKTAECMLLDGDVDDGLLGELWDCLDSADAACDIYLSPSFESIIEVGNFKIGSASHLVMVLEEISEELFDIPQGEVEEDEELSDFENLEDNEDVGAHVVSEDADLMRDHQLLLIWKTLLAGAKNSIRNGISLVVQR